MSNKRFIANRLEDNLIQMIDDILPRTQFKSRTAFFRTALTEYYSYVRYNIEQESVACSATEEEDVRLEEF